MHTCPACGAENPEEARFCATCGSTLATLCGTCGEPMPTDARFCPACGAAATAASSGAGEERKLVTILFADVTGSTALGEQLDPERMREVLDRFFVAMREEIEAEGGTVEKFIGDAVMAAFGVPTAHEDDPTRAVRAATRMLRRLDDVNASLAESHEVTLQIRIGVNTGEVLATTDPRPGEAMVTGDTVNAAARLQSAADPGTVVIGERTARGARGAFRLEPLGPLELKGKAQPVSAFVVVEELEQESGRGVPGLHAPIVGRDSELELLRSIYGRAVAEARPNLITVYGDAGVGKSRLAREFLEWLAATDPAPRTMQGRCLPYGDGITYWPLAEILKSTASVLDTDPPDLALEKIAKASHDILTDDVTADRARTTAALAYTVGVEDPAFGFGDMDPREVRVELHAAWRSFFSALGAARPTIVIVEDIHWADPALLDLLDELAEGVTGSVVFLCPARPELTSRRPGWGGGRRNFSSIALDPLDHDEAEHLIRALLAIDDLPDHVRSRILERGEGNPFFLEEILRHLIDGGHVFFEAGRWRAATAIGDVEIPDTVQAVLAARIDLLEPAAKRLLQGAAVVGRDFWPGPAGLLDGADRDDVDTWLRVLQDRDLIVSRLSSRISGEREFTFKHVLTRDVAYESLPHRERPAAHARVAAWIEATAGDRVGEFNELLAYHFSTAALASRESGTDVAEAERLRSKAFTYLLDASSDSRRRRVLKKARHLAEEAIGLAAGPLDRSLGLTALGHAYYLGGDGDPAWQAFRDAAELRASAVAAPDAIVADLAGRACDMPTRWPGSMRVVPSEEEVRACLDLGLAFLPEGPSEERVKLLMVRATWAFAYPERGFTDDELDELERAGLDAYETAMQLGLPNLASAALDATQSVPGSQGHWARAVEYSPLREQLLPVLTDLDEVGDVTACAAWGRYEIGEYRVAENWASEGTETDASVTFRLHSLAWRCVARFRLGEWDDALDDFRTIRGLLDERRDQPQYFVSHAYGAALLIDHARGASPEMERLADVLSPLESSSEGRFTRLRPWLAMLSVVRGDFAAAHELLDDLPAGWRIHGGEVLEARCELVRGEAAWRMAPSVVAEARAFAERGGLRVLQLFADRLEGQASLIDGDPVHALDLLTRARDGFAQHAAPYERARTELILADALRALDRPEEAAAASQEAHREFERLGVPVVS
jgi:class 3 adenylate cyclase/tetratricopeptide (TPR) repeat protein